MEERIFKLNATQDVNCEICQPQDVIDIENENTEITAPQKKRMRIKGFFLRCIIAIIFLCFIYTIKVINSDIEDGLYTKIVDFFTIEYTVDKETQIGKMICTIENAIETVLKQS